MNVIIWFEIMLSISAKTCRWLQWMNLAYSFTDKQISKLKSNGTQFEEDFKSQQCCLLEVGSTPTWNIPKHGY